MPTIEVSVDERDHIEGSGRCALCGHLMVCHDDEMNDCQLCTCSGGHRE